MVKRSNLDRESWLVAAGRGERPGDPLNVPLISTSNFILGGERIYSREDGTDTVQALEELIGGLEGGSAIAFASGMAAAAAVFELVPPGGAVTLPDDCYQGVARVAAQGDENGRWKAQRLAVEETAAWRATAKSDDLVWIESPSNPLLRVADLPAICDAGRKPGALMAVDNTFATPINQRPLELGADLVMHSATKFLGGHSDLLLGVVVCRDPEIADRVRSVRTLRGATPGALETFLTLRGLRTLHLRLERSQQSAAVLAERLAGHGSVVRTRYPGLRDHPGHEVASRVLDGHGAIVTFDLDGDGSRADRFCAALELVRHATSLGGVESTAERRAVIPGQEHLPETLIRLSVGCENVDDLWRDLERAIAVSRS